MYDLATEAEDRCKEIWRFMLLGSDKEVQKYFIGDIYKYKEENLIEALEDIIENVFEIEYENQVQSDARNFAEGIKKYLENEA